MTYMDPEWIIINTHMEFVDLAFRDKPRVLNRPGLKALRMTQTKLLDLDDYDYI